MFGKVRFVHNKDAAKDEDKEEKDKEEKNKEDKEDKMKERNQTW